VLGAGLEPTQETLIRIHLGYLDGLHLEQTIATVSPLGTVSASSRLLRAELIKSGIGPASTWIGKLPIRLQAASNITNGFLLIVDFIGPANLKNESR
jgi:hypothetical protein